MPRDVGQIKLINKAQESGAFPWPIFEVGESSNKSSYGPGVKPAQIQSHKPISQPDSQPDSTGLTCETEELSRVLSGQHHATQPESMALTCASLDRVELSQESPGQIAISIAKDWAVQLKDGRRLVVPDFLPSPWLKVGDSSSRCGPHMHGLSGFGPSWSCFASGSSTHFGEEIEDDIGAGMASFPGLEMVQMGGSDPMVVEPLAIVLPAL